MRPAYSMTDDARTASADPARVWESRFARHDGCGYLFAICEQRPSAPLCIVWPEQVPFGCKLQPAPCSQDAYRSYRFEPAALRAAQRTASVLSTPRTGTE